MICNRKSQSHVEFILAAFLFLTLIIFLFTALFVRTQPEAVKVGEQTACQNAEAIATALTHNPGVPLDWHTNPTGLTSLGLTNGTHDIIKFKKWERMELLGYQRVESTTPINTSWYACYQIYAFPTVEDAVCITSGDTASLCRKFGGLPMLRVSANSDNQDSVFRLRMFFPEKQGLLANPTIPDYEGDDTVSISSGDNGTLVEIYFHTSASDQDAVLIDFDPAGGEPLMSYIKFVKYESLGGELPVLIGNLTVKDCFGAGVPGNGTSGPSGVISAKKYCTAEKRAGLESTQNPTISVELFPTDVEVVAW